ncbi:MAG: phosphoheptose isomerase [Chloroflexi bacterium]|nr:phosphoheptose isomerase [Chloroflexota bacterium]|tara:strand:- start:373 stop:948 length:576 start_codon:yes stop_codon:yes gene_type:complete
MTDFNNQITQIFEQSVDSLHKSISLKTQINDAINLIINSIKNGNKLIIFGNGGSAADAQHIAAELIGRFKLERKSLPAIALTTDSSILTSLGNDYSYDIIFSRQCESLVLKNDVVMGISTSGNSKNVELGMKTSLKKGAKTIGLLGNNGGTIKSVSNIPIIVNSNDTANIQESHRVIYHIICNLVEKQLSG